MVNFEEIGRAIDDELRKLKRYLSDEVKPTTKRRLADALRGASQRLGKLAEDLDRREGSPPATPASAEKPNL